MTGMPESLAGPLNGGQTPSAAEMGEADAVAGELDVYRT
jgi:hypothetical protein